MNIIKTLKTLLTAFGRSSIRPVAETELLCLYPVMDNGFVNYDKLIVYVTLNMQPLVEVNRKLLLDFELFLLWLQASPLMDWDAKELDTAKLRGTRLEVVNAYFLDYVMQYIDDTKDIDGLINDFWPLWEMGWFDKQLEGD